MQLKDNLTLLTINAHSWMEADNDMCLETIAQAVVEQQVDILAMQEVNQSEKSLHVSLKEKENLRFVPSYENVPLCNDNFALHLSRRLHHKGYTMYWTWAQAHKGYFDFDEGLALFTKTPILETRNIPLSPPGTEAPPFCYRRVPGIMAHINGMNIWFYSIHLGWWHDEIDPFSKQWELLLRGIQPTKESVYLMGDFNAPAEHRNEGYDLIAKTGIFEDCFTRAQSKDDGYTVQRQIDGWRDRDFKGIRIDQIWTNVKSATLESRVIFNDRFYPVVSDHYGVLSREVVDCNNINKSEL